MKFLFIFFIFFMFYSCSGSEGNDITSFDKEYVIQDMAGGEIDITVSPADMAGGETVDVAVEETESSKDVVTPEDEFEGNDAMDTGISDEKDAGSENEVEATVDIEEEVIEPSFSDEKIQSICTDFCSKIEECCQIDGSADDCTVYNSSDCVDKCANEIKENPVKSSSFVCKSIKDCSKLDTCDEDETIPDVCTTTCNAISQCDNANYLLFFQVENFEQCQLVCAGLYNGTKSGNYSYFNQILVCVNNYLGDGICDVMSAFSCYDGIMCESLCQKYQECGKIEDFFNKYQKCVQMCKQFDTGSIIAESVCVDTAGCENSENCVNPPTSPDNGTDKLCTYLIKNCPDSEIFTYFPPDKDICSWFFTGLNLASDMFDFELFDECKKGVEMCNSDELFGCLAGFLPTCESFCSELEEKCEDIEDCKKDYCKSFSPFQLLAEKICSEMQTCTLMKNCTDIPEKPYQPAIDTCTKLKTLCANNPEIDDWFVHLNYCEWMLTGFKLGLGDTLFNSMNSCLTNINECSKDKINQCINF